MAKAPLSGAVGAVVACFCLAATATERRAPSASDFPEPNALPAHAEPVDALIMMDGSAVRTPDDWHGRRRPEVLKLLQHYLYGYSPPEELKEGTPPPRVVVEEANALGGKATARRIRIPLAPDPSVAIHVDLWVPNGGEGPFPTFLCIKYPNFPVSPLAREKPPWYEKAKPKIADGLKQVAYVIGRGYAFACFRANEAADHRFDKGIYPHYRPTRGKLLTWRYGGARAAHDWGEKMAWSWCARRAIDALVKQRGVDPNRIAVEGLSRNGVAALLTAAYHERVRLVICHQGSEFFGFGINRHVTHWYAAAVQGFQDKRDRLPVDTHCLVAAVAPRPILFSTSRTAGFCWPRFDAAMIRGAVPVYQLLGKPIQPLAIPKSGVGIIGTGPVRMYHRDGKHTITQEDWKHWLDFADAYLKGAGGRSGSHGQGAYLGADAAVRDMTAARDALVRRLEDRGKADAAKEAAADLHLTFDEGADRNELQVVLRRRGGEWLTGEAVVPYWRQETQVEKFSFLHRSGVASTTRDKFVYRVDPAELRLAGKHLVGTAEMVFRLDRLREERMVAGGRHLFTVDGRWSLMDKWRIVDHRRPMRQKFTVRAQVLPGASDLALVLHGGIDGKKAYLHIRLPQAAWRPPTIAAPRWNASVHEADATELRYDGGALSGSLSVRYVPDPWYPKQVHHVTYALSGKANGGRFEGKFRALVAGKEDIKITGQSRGRAARTGPREWEGTITGRAGQAVEGRYEASGDMGRYRGRVSGVMVRPGEAVEPLLPAPSPSRAKEPEAAVLEAAAEAGRLYAQMRALRMARAHYPYPVESALVEARLPAPRWTAPAGKANLDSAVAYVRAVRALVTEAAPSGQVARGRTGTGDPLFGPYYHTTPLAGQLPALPRETGYAGPQRWQHIVEWRVLGPIPQVRGRGLDTPAMPDLVPAAGAGYAVNADALGHAFTMPADGLLRWETVSSQPDGTLRPPAWTWKRKRVGGKRSKKFVVARSDTPGRPDTVWYAAREIVSPTDRHVYLGLSARDHARLWINDRLVWVDDEREWGHHLGAVAVVRASLRKGVNRLLARCRDDRGSSWVRIHVCTRGMPSEKAPAHGSAAPWGRDKVAGLAGDYVHCYPTAGPPLAWDVEKGINVLWRAPLAVARARGTGVSSGGQSVLVPSAVPPLLVTGGKVLANVQPHTLVCLSADTGKELWRRETNILGLLDKTDFGAWAEADDAERLALLKKHELLSRKARSLDRLRGGPPASDGERVCVVYDTGVAACYDLEGRRQWVVPTRTTGASIILAGDRLVLEGSPRGQPGKRGATNHTVAALDIATGKTIWTAGARGAYAGRGHLLRLVHGRARRDVLITRAWEAIDLATGDVLTCGAGADEWNWEGVWQGGDTLYSTYEDGSSAVRFWIDADGQLGSRMLWRRQRHHAFVAGGPGGMVSDGKLLFALRLAPEHAKHCPAYALSLDFLEPATGNHVGWLNPVLRGTNRRMSPVVAGEYLFLADSRGGPHSGGEPHERRITVLRRGPRPAVACSSPAPNNTANPVFEGKRMYLVLSGEIVCISVTTPEGRRYQDEQLARALFERMYREPDPGKPTVVAPLNSGKVPAATPVVKLVPGDTITGCMLAGPFPEHDAGAAPADLASGAELPRVGEELTIAGATRKFAPLDRKVIATDTSFHNDARLDDWQLRVTRRTIDVAALAGPEPRSVLYLYTVLDNTRPRLVFPTMEAPGMVAWLAGKKVAMGEPVRLAPGLYPLLIHVRPDAFRRKKPQRPMNVRKALDAGALRDVRWPGKWTVVGPLSTATGQLKADQLAAVPKKITIGKKTHPAWELPSTGRTLDLVPILDVPRDGKPKPSGVVGKAARIAKGLAAYCFAEADCPADGKLIVNASADWLMAWHVDGRRVYNTLRGGNARAATMATAHTFAVDVAKGKHVLAVLVRPGSKGWSLTSIGGLATDLAAGLAGRFPAPGGVGATEAEYRASPSFIEADDPLAVRAAWLGQVRQNRSQLEWVAKTLLDTEYARKAKRYLDALRQESDP